jgi:predicted secreted acid phosphatase
MTRFPGPHVPAAAFVLAACLAVFCNAQAAGNQDNLLCPAPQEPKALEAFHDCAPGAGCYAKEQEFPLADAIRYLDYRLANPSRAGERLAIVVDIDETALSNWTYLKDSHFVYNRGSLQQWWKREQDPAIPGTLELVKHAVDRKVAVFLISGRGQDILPYTEGNLKASGYPVESIKATGGIILKRAPPDPNNPCGYKSLKRRNIAEKGYTIILNVGDQYSDLEDCEAGGQRLTDTVSFRGERLVKLPNPFYCIP